MPDPTTDEVVREEIARRAYCRFCDRGGAHGSDIEDWLAAEREVLAEHEKPAEIPEKAPANPPRGSRRERR